MTLKAVNLSLNNEIEIQDYQQVCQAIEFFSKHWRDQPGIGQLANEMGLSDDKLNRLFKRFAGISPKSFLQALTLDHARYLLRNSASILDASYELGLSGPSRLHDLFVTYEAMPPGVYKSKGEGLDIYFGYHPSPFGIALIMVTNNGLAGLAFADEDQEASAFEDMSMRWPRANYIQDQHRTAPFVNRVFQTELWQSNSPLKLIFIGSDFQIRVWETLIKIPMGKATTYGDIARHLDKPTGAARAVGTAVGKNPISFVVPCHRVLGREGSLNGYHWGLKRKSAMIGWEFGQINSE